MVIKKILRYHHTVIPFDKITSVSIPKGFNARITIRLVDNTTTTLEYGKADDAFKVLDRVTEFATSKAKVLSI